MTMSLAMELLDGCIRFEVFADLPGIFGMVVSFPSHEVLFLTSYSPFLKDPINLIDGFLYFRVDVSDILL